MTSRPLLAAFAALVVLVVLVVLAMFGATDKPPAAHAAAAPADRNAPVVVGDRRFTTAELTAVAGRHRGDVRMAAQILIQAEWITREAAARGLVAPPAAVNAAVAEDRRQAEAKFSWGSYDKYLASIPETADARRADITSGILEELVIDAVVREGGPGPQAFGLAFRRLAAGERAVTTCLKAYAPEGRSACSNQPSDSGRRCTQTGIDDVCAYPKDGSYAASWGGHPDLITAFEDAPQASVAALDPDIDLALVRLRRYLRTHAPQALHHCDFDPDDLAYFNCSTRADATAVLYAATRIHQAAKRTWTVPATAGVVW